ncbi:MAG: ABC transporter ATP-binding protein, partial [Bauldia litoralis]
MTAPAAAELLRVDGLAVSYGNVRALEGISLTVEAGQIVTVIGPNGAGKSTLLNGLIGLVAEDEGDIRFDGRSVVDIPVEARVGEGMCLVPETRELFAAMTVEDNLMLGGFARYVRGDRALREELGRVYDLFPRLRERSVQYAGTLSGGERQMLALGRALMAKPRLLMLDEPSLGLAPIIVREIFGIIRSLREMGVAILLVEQNARAALQVASYGYVLETGELTLEGPADELENNPRVAAT